MEMSLIRPAFLVFSTLLLAACGSGEPRPPAWNPFAAGPLREEVVNGGPVAAMRGYDVNGDRTVTREELLARLRADFAAADTAGNGCLAETQVLVINQKRIETDQSTATPLQDWNQDGCVNFQEFATAPVSLFDQFDRNGDGRVTPQELDPRPGGRGGTGVLQEPAGRGGRGAPPPPQVLP